MSTPEQPAQRASPTYGQNPYAPQQPAAPQNPYGQPAPQQPQNPHGQQTQAPQPSHPQQQPQSQTPPPQGGRQAQPQHNPYAQQARPAHPSGRGALDTVAAILAGALLAWGVLATLILRIWSASSSDYYMSAVYNGFTMTSLILSMLLAIGAVVFGLLAFSKSKHWLTGFALGTGIVGLLVVI